MALPVIETPTFELTLPSQDKKIKYRPFLVKEEKVLLQALESGEDSDIKQAIKDCVKVCTFGEIEGGQIPTFDLEYIFLNIRAKSVGEVAKLRLLCPDDGQTYASTEIDLSKIEVQVDDAHTNVIEVNDKIKIIMKYPTIDSVAQSYDVKAAKTEALFDMIGDCIATIVDGEEQHNVKDYSKKELHEFLGSLDRKTFDKMNKFFETMPQLREEIELENPKTKVKSKIVLKGAQDFFVLPSLTTA